MIRDFLEALGIRPHFVFALKNRGRAKSDSCGIALAGPPAPGGGRVSVLARPLFTPSFSYYGVVPRARAVALNTHTGLPIFGRKLLKSTKPTRAYRGGLKVAFF